MNTSRLLPVLCFLIAAATVSGADTRGELMTDSLRVRIEFGHTTTQQDLPVTVEGRNLVVLDLQGKQLEEGEETGFLNEFSAGAGDVDALVLQLAPVGDTAEREPQSIWAYLLEHTNPGAAERLEDDPSLTAWAPVVTVKTSLDGQRGFSFALSQLVQHGAMWLPDHGVFITLADNPTDLQTHLDSLSGQRVLEQVANAPEATWKDFSSRWKDMGSADYLPDWHTVLYGLPGHVVCVSPSHGSLYKYAIGRWGSIRPDLASPHKFRLDFIWPNDAGWREQRLEQGTPIIQTRISTGSGEVKLDQFAAPLDSHGANGGPGVLLTKAQLPSSESAIEFRLQSEKQDMPFQLVQEQDAWAVQDEDGRVWLLIQPVEGVEVKASSITDEEERGIDITCSGAGEVVIKLISPTVPPTSISRVASLSHVAARADLLRHWDEVLAGTAHFEVPDEQVNQLFRSNLWHALRLPRFREGEGGKQIIDLPYSNTAYGQHNVEWAINQAVYVDYMLYSLRGQFDVAEQELAAIYRQQQRDNGRIAGFANWGVYTPSMLYATAQFYLLSQDREAFDRLLEPSLRALEWCLDQVEDSQLDEEAPGLVRGPLNDLTNRDGAWAFTLAYYYAGINLFGQALDKIDHPLSEKCEAVAAELKRDIVRAFNKAAVLSPIVQLADGAWINYVPCDALTHRRLMDVWYPTDIDTGALHLARLEAINPNGQLTEWLIHDHEDNLFLNQWGMANEPVYNQQATAYLLRDEPEAVIRAFYSMMACAFSHGQLEPVEHRWAWGQFFGPPSTDGAWFELYRRMLIFERDNTLQLAKATPRAWLEDGKEIRVEQAPTWFGPISLHIKSEAASARITAQVELPGDNPPQKLKIRLRHPDQAPMKSVLVNGAPTESFNPDSEWITIENPAGGAYKIEARY